MPTFLVHFMSMANSTARVVCSVIYKFLGPRQFFWFTRLGYLMFFHRLAAESKLCLSLLVGTPHCVKRNPELVAFFERISRFALSLELMLYALLRLCK